MATVFCSFCRFLILSQMMVALLVEWSGVGAMVSLRSNQSGGGEATAWSYLSLATQPVSNAYSVCQSRHATPCQMLAFLFFSAWTWQKRGQPLRPHHPIWQRKVNRGNKEDIWSMASLDLPFISRALLVDPPTLYHGAVVHGEPQFIPNSTQCKRLNMTRHFREDPYQMLSPTFGHCPFGGGGSKRLPRWFGILI